MVNDLQEIRPASTRYPAKSANNAVVDVTGQLFRAHDTIDIRVEHLEEVAESLGFCLQSECLVSLQIGSVAFRVVGEGDAVKPEIRAQGALFRLARDLATLNMVEGGGSERQGWL